MAARDEVPCWDALIGPCLLFLVASVFGYLFYGVWLEVSSGNAEYTVTITSVDGLDPAALAKRSAGDLAALNPVFGVAVRIDNTLGKVHEKCVGMHTSAAVSYGDAVLGRGTVPEFCACAFGVGEALATAWGLDVQVPRFLLDRLAGELERGEAVVDVAVRTPGNCRQCRDTVLVCKAKIGGGPSPCLVTHVYQWLNPRDEL